MTTDVTELCERLRAATVESNGDPARGIGRVTEARPVNPDGPEAAEALSHQADLIEKLRWALWPLARLLKHDDRRTPDAAMVVAQYGMRKLYGLSIHDLRHAKRVFDETGSTIPDTMRDERDERAGRLYEAIRGEAPNGELVGVHLWPDGDWDVLKPGRVVSQADTAAWLRRLAPTFQPAMNSEAALRFAADRIESGEHLRDRGEAG